MNNIYRLLSGIVLILAFTACQNEGNAFIPDDQEENERVPIQLNGLNLTETQISRAVPSDFPNNQQIGVIASQYPTIDWTAYSDIRNAVATATSVSQVVADTFFFTWQQPKYWPFDGSELVFMAYSPAANNTSVTLQTTTNSVELALSLTNPMPDVMYASNNENAESTPYSKADSTTGVYLGEFRHALSKVTVKVIAGDTMNPAIRLTSLIVRTTRTSGRLDLLQGDNGLIVDAASTPFEFNLVSTSTNFSNNAYSHDIYLFPDTQDDTQVYIKLKDGYFEVEGWYNISDFINNVTNLKDLEFVQGVHTTLTFTVKSTLVEEPSDSIILEGKLTDWLDKGDYEIKVN